MIIVERDMRDISTTYTSETGGAAGDKIEDLKQALEKLENENKDILDSKSKIRIKDLEAGQKFYGTITTTIKDDKTGKKCRTQITSTFKVLDNKQNTDKLVVRDLVTKQTYNTSRKGTSLKSIKESIEKQLQKEELKKKIEKIEKEKKEFEEKAVSFKEASTLVKLRKTIESGIKNLWLVGPAGSGKSVMTRMLASELGIPCLCISCGVGTSSTEFVGYKYPVRESTKFAEYYSKPSIILLDEFTSLDPAVAQICNAALANDEIETTTGTVYRDPNCIIIATSNTFGDGASRQYVANNQLDSATLDRFVGGIIEVDYSKEYESQYDKEVVKYVECLREIIKSYDLRRIASTRMIQAGCALKKAYVQDWREQLIVNWAPNEKRIVMQHKSEYEKENEFEISYSMAA